MTCGLRELPEDCAAVHIAPALGLLPTAENQWSGPCPVCRGPRRFSLAVKKDGRKDGRLVWCCHREPACAASDIRDALAALVPACISPSRPTDLSARRADKIARSDLEPLLELDDCARLLRLACIVWRLPPKEAKEKLGMSRSTYYRAVSGVPNLGRNRRSA